jgi:hypothetical protein
VKITQTYLVEQRRLHQSPGYGVASRSYAAMVADLANAKGARSISDYGAGKCNLRNALYELGKFDFAYYPYDPVFPKYGPPRAADLVCCIDVLEHVEPDCLDEVLDELGKITIRHGLFTIHTGSAAKTLSDGRNAHLIRKPASWWLPRICDRLEITHLQSASGGFWLLVEPRAGA